MARNRSPKKRKLPEPALDQAAAQPAPPTVGEQLRHAREGMHQTIGDVSERLRIRKILLEALENDDHGNLPGGIYSIGFVRSYAKYLGLDSGRLEEQWREEAEALTRAAEYSFPKPTLERRLPSFGAIALGVLLLAGVITATVYLPGRMNKIESNIPDVPEQLRALVPELTQPESELADGGTATQLTAPLDVAGMPTQPINAATGGEEVLTPSLGAVPVPGEEYGVPEAEALVSRRASRDVWLQVRDTGTDAIVLTRVLHAGDMYRPPNQDGLVLTVGDAGALTVLGKTGGSFLLGKDGEVLNDVTLTEAGLTTASKN